MTQKVERANIENTVSATGEIGAEELVDVGAQVSGEIQKLYVELGQKVKKGDLIAQIDSTTQQNEIDINKAKLESYKIQLQSAKVSFKVAAQQYERAKKLIKSKKKARPKITPVIVYAKVLAYSKRASFIYLTSSICILTSK